MALFLKTESRRGKLGKKAGVAILAPRTRIVREILVPYLVEVVLYVWVADDVGLRRWGQPPRRMVDDFLLSLPIVARRSRAFLVHFVRHPSSLGWSAPPGPARHDPFIGGLPHLGEEFELL